MIIKVNGISRTIDQDSLKVLELITLDKVQDPDMVSVQLNGEFLDRTDYGETILKDGDEIDFLYFMGGGLIPDEYIVEENLQ
jgi:sulfur carrier protein